MPVECLRERSRASKRSRCRLRAQPNEITRARRPPRPTAPRPRPAAEARVSMRVGSTSVGVDRVAPGRVQGIPASAAIAWQAECWCSRSGARAAARREARESAACSRSRPRARRSPRRARGARRRGRGGQAHAASSGRHVQRDADGSRGVGDLGQEEARPNPPAPSAGGHAPARQRPARRRGARGGLLSGAYAGPHVLGQQGHRQAHAVDQESRLLGYGSRSTRASKRCSKTGCRHGAAAPHSVMLRCSKARAARPTRRAAGVRTLT